MGYGKIMRRSIALSKFIKIVSAPLTDFSAPRAGARAGAGAGAGGWKSERIKRAPKSLVIPTY